MKYINVEELGGMRRGKRLQKNDKFSFLCHRDISCFNRCCRNLNMFLYPYDVMCLKNSLGKTSDYFIEKYLDVVMREGNYFPDVLLRMNDNDQMTCPFLMNDGCSVYHDRPHACRTFPIEQGVIHRGAAQSDEMVSFFKPPNFCMGQHEAPDWTIKTWYKNQSAEAHSHMTVQWSSVKRLFRVNPWDKLDLSGVKAKMAFMAAYNIDSFRDFVFNSSFLKRYEIKNKILKKIGHSETELLKLGFNWIKLTVWGIRSNTIATR